MNIDDAKALAVRSIHIMGNGTLEDFHEVVHPEFLNHEAKDEPPAARERGPAGATPPRCGCAARSPSCTGRSARSWPRAT